MKSTAVFILIMIAIILVGYMLPLDSYTLKNGICVTGEPAITKRLQLIKGETLEKMQRSDVEPGPLGGCKEAVTYVQYLF